MKFCQDRQETMLLDVHDELAPHERSAWEAHLEVCEGCRQERDRLRQLLQCMKEVMPSPNLSPEKAAALADSLLEALKEERGRRWWQGKVWGFPNRLIPAFASVCLAIVVFAWFGMREVESPPRFQAKTDLYSEHQMIAKDLDVIRNLELLEEMEVLEKLVRVVDERNSI